MKAWTRDDIIAIGEVGRATFVAVVLRTPEEGHGLVVEELATGKIAHLPAACREFLRSASFNEIVSQVPKELIEDGDLP